MAHYPSRNTLDVSRKEEEMSAPMTRAHFSLIASALRASFSDGLHDQPLTLQQQATIVKVMASALSFTNNNFNYGKFYEATLKIKETK